MAQSTTRLLVAFVLCSILAETSSGQPADLALDFTDSGYVDLGDPGDAFDLDPVNGRTYMFWVRHDTTLYHAKLLDKRTKGGPGATGVFGFTIFVQQFTGTLGIYLTPVREIPRADAFIGTAGLTPVIDKTWHHVAIVQDGNTVHAYVDGKEDFSYEVPAALLVTDKPLWLGWNSRDIVHFRGQMDELSIWNRPFSRSEIQDWMYDRPESGDDGLLGYWPFDDGDADIVSDHSANGNHGRAYHVGRIEATRPLSPPFKETVWYFVLIGLGVVGFVAAISWLSAAGLRRRNRQLEALVQERTAEVAKQAEELKALDASKSRFFANISHEFRTPLTISLGMLDDLLTNRRTQLSTEIHDDLTQVGRSNRILLRLVNQLLDVARLESHQLKLQIRPFDLVDAMRAFGAAFESIAQREDIAFEIDLPETFPVWLDPEQIELIATNLLSNAFKFSPAGATVRLKLESVDAGQSARIEVADTGPGIAADRLPHIFDRFYQTDDSHQQIGTGIGLSFVKEVVELHGGSVSAESVVAEGSTFVVQLPVGRQHYENLEAAIVSEVVLLEESEISGSAVDAAEDILAENGAGASSTDTSDDIDTDRKTILVVDDNADIRGFIRRHLGQAYRVIEAADGQKALDMAHKITPDLVISDVMMPNLDGFGLVERMRATPDLDFIPILLLTARVETEDRLAGLGLGADAYLHKPFSTDELKLRVRNAIARQERLRVRLRQESNYTGDGAADAVEPPSTFRSRVKSVARINIADEGFGVESLADAMAVERTTLYRQMMDEFGKPPNVFLREFRLDEAARLLGEGAGTISEVAYAVGFQSVSYFSRRFKERFGSSPSQYSG